MALPTSMQYSLYLPRVLLRWLTSDDDAPHFTVDGTLIFSDISGFTALTEQLAEKGREGAEEVTGVLNGAFTELLNVAALEGGDLIKFGGDALLHLFTGDGHAARAALAAFDMRDALDDYQQAKSPTPLTMSVGLASGPVQIFIAGETSRELIISGPTATLLTEMEGTAESGEILLSRATAEELDDFALGDEKGGGILLEDAPDADDPDDDEVFNEATVDLSQFVSSRLRKHLTLGFNEGEHRTANVAFVKLEGFDAHLAEHGEDQAASDLHDVVAAVQRAAEHYAVSFLQTDISADGVKMILASGVPERADGDRERMLRALYEAHDVESPFDLHIGAAHGSVFAGDLGARTRRVYTVMGDTVNLAARLASAATTGQVLVTEEFDDVGIFETTPLEPVSLKGKAKPVTPYELGEPLEGVGIDTDESSLPLVGRGDELERFEALVTEAAHGSGSIVTVVGAAGMGKTRLLRELRSQAAESRTLVAVCEPYEANTAYFAFGQILRGALGLDDEGGKGERAKRLVEILGGMDSELLPFAPLVARAAGVSMETTPEVEALDAKFQETKTAEIVADVLTDVLDGQTLVFVDGAQWMDEASASLIEHLVPTVAAQPWVVVVARRPTREDDHTDGDDPTEHIHLGPLDAEATAQLAAIAIGNRAVPAPVVDAIVTRSGGNPFFLLELVDSATSGGGELPTSVEAAVAARIDHLQVRDRRLLGYAAVLGQQFSLDLMADALPDAAASVDDVEAWERLGEFLETSLGGKVRFRQPIVRDVAYEGLPFERRRQLHEAIGEALERRARNRPERFAELLSLHFDRARVFAKAWEYSVMAAERARRKYANVDAAELYRRALDAEQEMDAKADPLEKAKVAEALGDVTEVTGLYDRAEEAYLEALRLFGDTGLDAGRVLLKRGILRERTSDYDEGIEILAKVGLALADAGDEGTEIALEARVETAAILSRKGDLEQTVAICQEVIDAADTDAHPRVLAHAYYLMEFAYTRLNHSDRGKVGAKAAEIYRELKEMVRLGNTLNNLGYDAFYLGHWTEAFDFWTEAKETRDKAGDIIGSALQENNLAEIAMHRGDLDEARALLEHALRVWRGAGYEVGVAYASANLGLVASRQGHREEAKELLDAAVESFTSAGAEAYLPDVRVRYAEYLLAGGEADAALEMLEPDLESSTTSGDTLALSTLHRLIGIARYQKGDIDGARTCLEAGRAAAEEANAIYDRVLALETLSALSVAADTPDAEVEKEAEGLRNDLGLGDFSTISPLMISDS